MYGTAERSSPAARSESVLGAPRVGSVDCQSEFNTTQQFAESELMRLLKSENYRSSIRIHLPISLDSQSLCSLCPGKILQPAFAGFGRTRCVRIAHVWGCLIFTG